VKIEEKKDVKSEPDKSKTTSKIRMVQEEKKEHIS